MGSHRLPSALLGFALLTNAAVVSQRANALIITPTFDASITSAPNALAIENSIDSVINTYDRLFSDPIDVSIYFKLGDLGNLLGQTQASFYVESYAFYTAVLAANASILKNHILTTAVSNLASGDVVNQIFTTSAALRALDYTSATGLLGSDGVAGHGTFRQHHHAPGRAGLTVLAANRAALGRCQVDDRA